MAKETDQAVGHAHARPARDDRREHIVSVAHKMFLANGYAGTSMSAIAQQLGGSKGTLYNYFPSKEDLFAAVVEKKCEQFLSVLSDIDVNASDLRAALVRFAAHILEVALSDDSVATNRLVTAECVRFPEIGHAIYFSGPERGFKQLGAFLAQAKLKGQLKADADVDLAAVQFFALTMHNMLLRRLWVVSEVFTLEDIRKQAEAAVSTFLRAFGA